MVNTVTEQFSKFVSFAEDRLSRNEAKAIATKGDVLSGAGTTLEERKISKTTNGDFVWKFYRGGDTQAVNNEVRDLFRKTVAAMFGGERNIPESVKTAMLLKKDFGKGKPLTARRIIAVRDAIAELNRGNGFDKIVDAGGALAKKAFAAGYTRLDFGKLNTAANLLAEAKSLSLKDALEQVITKGSAANRTMESSSLHMKDAESFRRGLDAYEHIALGEKRNLEVVKACASENASSGLAEVAENLAYKFSNLLNDAEQLRADAKLPRNTLDGLRTVANSLAERFGQIQSDISSGALRDRGQIYARMFADTLSLVAKEAEKVVKALRDAGARSPAVEEFRQHLIRLGVQVSEEQTQIAMAYKSAVALDMTASAEAKIRSASQQGAMKHNRPDAIPSEILENIGKFLNENPFERIKNVEKFCSSLEEHGDANLRFTDAHKADLRKLVEQVFGNNPKADKILQRVIDKFETSFFADQLHSPTDFGSHPPANRDTVVNYLKKNPEALHAFDPGFKLDTQEDVDTVKGTIKKLMLADLDKKLKEPDTNKVTSLSSGLMPQAVREYDPGYVTFNGEVIPNAQLGTKFPQLSSDSQTPFRRGYAEFLEKTFDASHKKMRQMVSYTCGMADGLGGTIDHLIQNGGEGSNLKGRSRSELTEIGAVISSGGRQPEENYNIEIAQNGDVKITFTHFIRNKVSNIIDMQNGNMYNPKVLTPQPADTIIAGIAKVVTTITIRNASDEELGDAMPEFTIDDIRQEEE